MPITGRALKDLVNSYIYNVGVLTLPLDEGVGTVAYDKSGLASNGTLTGPTHLPTWGAGRFGTAVSLDGVDDYIDCGTPTGLNFTTQNFSLSAWVYPTKISNTPYIFDKTLWTNYGYALQITPTGRVQMGTVSAAGYLLTLSYAGDVALNGWYHIVAVRNGAAGKIYVNGTDRTETAPALVDLGSSAARSLRIGGTGEYLQGVIDEIRIFSRALTQAEVTSLYVDW